MGRTPCCKDEDVKRGPWTAEEDKKLRDYIQENGGHGSWRRLPALAGLNRCGKSCRLRWTNYLRPDIRRGSFSEEEERLIIDLHSVLGNKWSSIAGRLPGRTDNEIKNYWNTHLRKKLQNNGIDPVTHRPRTDLGFLANLPSLLVAANLSNLTSPWNVSALQQQAEAAQLLKLQLASNLIQLLTAPGSSTTTTTTTPNMDGLGLTALFGSPASLMGGYQPSALQLPGLVQCSPPLNSQSPIPMESGTTSVSCPNSNSELPASLSLEQPAAAMECCSSDNAGIEMSSGSACTGSTAPPASDTSAPSLVSSSPEIFESPVEQINSGDCPTSKGSSQFTLFETWDIFDQNSDDFSWKDLFEQISGPKAANSL